MKSRTVSVLLIVAVLAAGLGLRAFWARADCTSGGPDPGMVVVVGEAPVVMQFALAPGIDYKFNYPANVALWTTPLRTTPIPSGSVFTSGSGAIFGDANGDGQVRLDDLIFIRNRSGATHAPSDLNASGVVDQNDLVLCLNALGAGPGTLVVYVDGVSASSVLCDTAIQLLTDPGEDGVFILSEARGLTVVAISASPTSGSFGTPIAVTIEPAIAPLAFDANTTAKWTGIYHPVVGADSDSFSIFYAADQFRESSGSSAQLIVGDSSLPRPVPTSGFAPGSFIGYLSVSVPGGSLSKVFTFQFLDSAISWFRVSYPQDDQGYLPDPPVLETDPLEEIPIYPVPQGGAVPEFLNVAYYFHTACVLKIDQNSVTSAVAPAAITVNLIAVDDTGQEVDRVSNVSLQIDPDDGDPNQITYHNDLARPIVFVEGNVNKSVFPDLTILNAAENGTAIAIEAHP